MDAKKIRVLLVEDNPTDKLLVVDELAHVPEALFSVVHVEQLNEALVLLEAQRFDVVLLDLSLPDSHGFETFVRLHDAAPETPIVVLSARADGQLAVQAVQAGAQDYLVKGRLGEDVLPRSIRYAIERQRADRGLAESEERYRLLIQQSPDAYLVHCDGEIVFANVAALKMFGAECVGQLLGKPFLQIVAPEFRSVICQRVKTAEANGSNPPIQALGIRLDGTTVAKEGTSNPFVHEGRSAVQVVLHDLTKRKHAEEALGASEEKYRGLFEGTRDAIMTMEAPSWRYTSGNPAAIKIFGAKNAEDFVSYEPCDVSPEQQPDGRASAEKAREMIETALREGSHGFEWTHRRIGGVEFAADVLLTRVQQGGKAIIHATVRDITERKKLEQQFLRAQRMESIGTLAGGIAHDLNNSLGPIIMSLELLKMKFTEPASQELLAIISTSAQRGADMVRQVLSFARGVEGRRMEVQLKHILGEIEKIANDTFLKNIEVRTIFPHNLWTVIGDPTQLHQVLLNLCVNARDAMPNGGALTLSAENLTVDTHYARMSLNFEAQPGPYVCLQVKDSGAGMPPEIVEKIFDPFFTTKEIGKGTGLGLSTSLAIVKSHGGFIRVYSERGKGTRFSVYLPAQTEASAEMEAESTPKMPRGTGELILIVDDESAVRQITQQTLEAFGYRVVLASDGAEAVAIFARQGAEIAAVLTDMTMPVMDGRATIQVLRRMDPAVRIVAASGLSTNGDVAHASDLGVKHFLLKPFTAETLLRVLQQTLEEA